MLEYYKLFLDFQQLCADISNISATLENVAELDIFIGNSKYSSYLNQVTQDEQHLTSLHHKYTGQQLVETLDKFLMAPDSPIFQENQTKRTDAVNKLVKQFKRSLVNQVETEDVNDSENLDSKESSYSSNDKDNAIETALYAIKVPITCNSKKIYKIYCESVHQIAAQPNIADNPSCIVCDQTHRFDKCPVLQNQDFL